MLTVGAGEHSVSEIFRFGSSTSSADTKVFPRAAILSTCTCHVLSYWHNNYFFIIIILFQFMGGFQTACLLLLFSTAATALLCYTRPCRSTENDLCIKQCSPAHRSCSKQATSNRTSGEHLTTVAACSFSTDNCATKPNDCDLRGVNGSDFLSACCCTTDYCNGWFRDAMSMYPWLTVSRPLPKLSPPANDTSSQSVVYIYIYI